MRIFVSEFLCGGGLAEEDFSPSLLREGELMLRAIVDDLLAIENCHVVSTVDSRFPHLTEMKRDSRWERHQVRTKKEEQCLFERLARSSSATLVVAPETAGELESRVCKALELSPRILNCHPKTVALCGDKLFTANYLLQHGLPTVPTDIVDWNRVPVSPFETDYVVLKPRDGAGSELTVKVQNSDWIKTGTANIVGAAQQGLCESVLDPLLPRSQNSNNSEWNRIRCEFERSQSKHVPLIQPFIDGESLSVMCLCCERHPATIFPVARQLLSHDFKYKGGCVPARILENLKPMAIDLVKKTCEVIPGLNGFIGFDLIVPRSEPEQPLIVEINPRLTTSYIGYRRICHQNLAERLLARFGLFDGSNHLDITWKNESVSFDVKTEFEKAN